MSRPYGLEFPTRHRYWPRWERFSPIIVAAAPGSLTFEVRRPDGTWQRATMPQPERDELRWTFRSELAHAGVFRECRG